MKRFLPWLFVLFLLFNQVIPVYAAEDTDETIDLIDTFYATTSGKDHSLNVPFNRSWFQNDARVYNHNLAKLSLGLATSAFRPSKRILREKRSADYNVRSFLDQAGFADLRSDDYDKAPSMYTVSTVMGHQTIGKGDDAFELISVGICGQGYMDEWESNLTVGTGRHPEGFYNAAHLVYDRVFGYISENHIKGKKKIWISGFSRAAAVSNITASLLSDSDFFSQESVFAYTFATPNTVRSTTPKLYENIFNICGKMDPVTNVPFADWGYSRYGITYFTPTMETDSDFWEKRVKADRVYKEISGVSYWANPDMNSQLRVLMDCMISICPDVETYTEQLQHQLISLWEKHDWVSIMQRLLEMGDNPIMDNDENRVAANILMNQISYLIMDYFSSENSFRRFNPHASVSSNFLQTHTPELYISWIFSADDPAELYTDFSEYTLIYVQGDTDISISRDHMALEKMTSGEKNLRSYHYMSVRDDKISVLVPRDRDYNISITSNSDQDVVIYEAKLQTGRHAPDETMTYTSDMKTGDVMNIGYEGGSRVLAPEGSFETSIQVKKEASETGIDLLLYVYSYPDDVTWRDIFLSFLILAVLAITTVVFIITLLSLWVRHRYKRSQGYIPKDLKFRPLPIICFFMIQQVFLTKEFFTALYEPSVELINHLKIIIGILILIIAFYGYRRKKDHFHRNIMFAVILLTGADVMMTTSIVAGACLYIAAYILLCVNFVLEDRLGILRILIWIALSAALIFGMMQMELDIGNLQYLAMAYIITGAALVVTAFTHSSRTSRGSILLFIAGILIVLNIVQESGTLMHIASAALHYIAVCMLASTGSGYILPKLYLEYVPVPEKSSAGAHEVQKV